jgi:tetratricopeptide (TPR) repeat protein
MTQRDTLERRFYEGECSAAGGDHERAHAAFLECVSADPASGRFVQAFLANLKQLPASTQQTALPVADAEALFERAAAEQNWAEVLRRGPRILSSHRSDARTLVMLAAACHTQSFADSEPHFWRAALEAAADDVEIQRQAARAFARVQLLDEALACWRRVEAHDPADEEPPRMIASLTIAKSRRRGGLAGADDASGNTSGVKRNQERREPVTRFVMGNLDALVQSITHAAELSFTPIQRLEAAIRERPSIPELYLRLAQLYLDKDRDYDAERLLGKGRETTDRDARVQQMWEEVTMLRHARRIEMARQEVKTADNPQTREALAQAVKDRDRVELEIFRARVKRTPEAAEHQYELGRRLMRIDKLREARPHFEKALDDTTQRGPAALELARCAEQLGEIPQALAHCRAAAEAARVAGQFTIQQAALNEAAKLAKQMKLTRLAQRYLAQMPALSDQ